MFSHHLTSKRRAIGARTHTHPVAFEFTTSPITHSCVRMKCYLS